MFTITAVKVHRVEVPVSVKIAEFGNEWFVGAPVSILRGADSPYGYSDIILGVAITIERSFDENLLVGGTCQRYFFVRRGYKEEFRVFIGCEEN